MRIDIERLDLRHGELCSLVRRVKLPPKKYTAAQTEIAVLTAIRNELQRPPALPIDPAWRESA
jgi:hypothetical protein